MCTHSPSLILSMRMGTKLTPKKFQNKYSESFPELKKYAEIVGKDIQNILDTKGLHPKEVKVRPKEESSVQEKMTRDKKYTRDSRQLTDLVGVRVILNYQDEVDIARDILAHRFEVDEQESIDKRMILGSKEFGYRSVHLIVRDSSRTPKCLDTLNGGRIEIQIRSVLENAWCDIEHEIVYKSGVKYPKELIRNFAAAAAMIELIDREFVSLRNKRDELVEKYVETYKLEKDKDVEFDTARLWAYLEHVFPDGYAFRHAIREAQPVKQSIVLRCIKALKAAKITTPRSLGKILKRKSFKNKIADFAANNSLEPSKVSHLAIIKTAVANVSEKVADSLLNDVR